MCNSEIRPMTMAETESLLASKEVADVVVALISAALYGESRRRVNELILQRLADKERTKNNFRFSTIPSLAGPCEHG